MVFKNGVKNIKAEGLYWPAYGILNGYKKSHEIEYP